MEGFEGDCGYGVSLIDVSIFDTPANCRDYPTLLDASLAGRPASTTWSQVSAQGPTPAGNSTHEFQLPRRTTVLNYTLCACMHEALPAPLHRPEIM